MRSTRKKTSKPVYKDENDSEPDGDFSDSGSDAQISEQSASSDDDDEDAFQDSFHQETSSISVKVPKKTQTRKQININIKPIKTKFAKELINKICSRKRVENEDDHCDVAPYFSVKNMTESDKLLPSILNLSESDSSDDDAPKPTKKKAVPSTSRFIENKTSESETEASEYRDVWSKNLQDSEEIAKQTFLELEKHKTEVEETKASIQKYTTKHAPDNSAVELDIKDLLAQGEAFSPEPVPTKKTKRKKVKNDSDSEMEDWEEVDEAKAIPNQGLQLIVDFPGAPTRKQKTLDVEMMMRRKINRVKKEYQVYMHKVHVLCWLGHGNYVSRVINDQEVLAAALSLVPSKECYPSDRVDIKYLEQITKWYKDKMTIKQDKNEEKFRPKAPPLKELLLSQIKNKTATTKKYLVFIFVALLRALGLQCRVMFNFVVLPLKPPSSELCSLSTKQKDGIKNTDQNAKPVSKKNGTNKAKIDKKGKPKAIPQIDGNIESCSSDSDSDIENIIQVDGSNDSQVKTRKGRSKVKKDNENVEDVSPPKRTKLLPEPKKEASSKLNVESVKPEAKTSKIDANKIKTTKLDKETKENSKDRVSVTRKRSATSKSEKSPEPKKVTNDKINDSKLQDDTNKIAVPSPRKTRNASKSSDISEKKSNSNKINKPVQKQSLNKSSKKDVPKLKLNDVEFDDVPSKYFGKPESSNVSKILSLSRKRTQSAKTTELVQTKESENKSIQAKARTRSAPGNSIETSKYFDASDNKSNRNMKCTANRKANITKDEKLEDMQRVSHKDLASKNKLIADDVTTALVDIIKSRVREAKVKSKIGLVKPKHTDSDEDSDHLPEEKHKVKHNDSDSDCDFKPTKISPRPAKLTPKATKLSPKPGSSRKIDRRVLSSEDELPTNKVNVWCEVYVEELEQWSPVDVVGGKVHCAGEIYSRATHPVCYIVGWDNFNRLKDLTRRYVPQWNTVTRKLRADAAWWRSAVAPWLGASTPRDREEDEQLDRMQIEAPLPKSVAEYKNHPLYALKRHLLKFEAIYPADAPTLGFVRNEPVYARECVHTCRSRDTWLKEAKVVRLGEKPYKIVKARPKWDKLSNRMISDIPLEVFGPWQVADYEPPTAENGVVPRNAYGNVELFKMCMLPKGTVHVKLPGLNKVAKKLNIDCAPAMTGFDYNGGYSHPVYDGYVVCAEFEEVITEAWLLDQEEQERKENEKLETRVYGNWKRLIKGLLIRERLKHKYGFQEPSTSKDAKSKPKAPKLVVKKKSCL